MPPKGTKRKADDDEAYGKRKSKTAKKTDGKAAAKAPKSDPELATLRYLLGDGAKDLILSKDKKDEKLKTTGRGYRTKPGELSPFEELICATILAKPISHKLGVRAIAVVLNAPYSFTTPKALNAAGDDKRRQALEDAKTQHRQKTAAQLGTIADAVIEHFGKSPTDTSLEKLRESGKGNPDEISDLLTSNIKGIGALGISLLFRRLQGYKDWTFLYPFADERSLDAANELGLPSETPEDLSELIESHKEALGLKSELDVAKAYAVVLDRAIAIHLDRQVGAAKKAIGKSE